MAEEKSYYPGIFDLAKGWVMLAIFMVHTLNFVYGPLMETVGDSPVRRFALQLVYQGPLLLNAAMMMLFMISGFGFRKSSPLRTLGKQAKELLIPYALTGAAASVLYYVLYRLVSPPDAPIGAQALCHVRGYLMGVTDTNVIPDGWAVYVGAIWFLLALFLSWNLLNLIMQILPDRWIWAVCVFLSLAGYGLAVLFKPQFCISQALIGVLPLYIGFYLREKNVLLKRWPWWVLLIAGIGALCSVLFGDMKLANYRFVLGPAEIPAAICTSLLLMRLCVMTDSRITGRFADALREIGRYSLWILCVHTVEMKAVPWYWVLTKLHMGLAGSIISTFLIRCVLVWVMFKAVQYTVTKVRRLKRKKKRNHRRSVA